MFIGNPQQKEWISGVSAPAGTRVTWRRQCDDPREDHSGVFCLLFISIVYLRVDFQCEVFQSIYLCLSLGIGVVS